MFTTGKPQRERAEGESQQNKGRTGPPGSTNGQAGRVPEGAKCLDAGQLLLSPQSNLRPDGPDSAVVLPSLCKVPQTDCPSVYLMNCREIAVSISPNAVSRTSAAQGQSACI